LKLSWTKTKLQNIGAGDPPSTFSLDGIPVEGVEEFTYLGSKQCSTGYCRPDMLRRIGLACSVMVSMQRVWKCSYLKTSTKIHLYQALVMQRRNMDTSVGRCEDTGCVPYEMPATDT